MHTKLLNARLADCYSQNKNELIFSLNLGKGKGLVYLRVDLNPGINLISLPKESFRSKKNSVSIFKDILSSQVVEVRVTENDRSFIIQFENSYTLFFKLYGNQSNIVLFKDNEAVDLFRKKIIKDKSLNLADAGKKIDYSEDAFFEEEGNLIRLYPTFGPFVKEIIKEKWAASNSLAEKWKVVQIILNQLNSGKIYIIRYKGLLQLSLIEAGEIIQSSNDAIELLNQFAKLWSAEYYREKKREAALLHLRREEKNIFNFISRAQTSLDKIKEQQDFRNYGDLIMANLNKIGPYDETVTLEDFYSGTKVTIPLKKGLSAQKNAENYYRKGKNQGINIHKTEQNIEEKSRQYEKIKNAISSIEKASTIKEIDLLIEPFFHTKEKKSVQKPYKVFDFMDYEIRVGRNAKSNDETTFKFSHKEDLWLHVKDATGSHVIVKHKAGSNIPAAVIGRAARIAAFYSKRKTESLVPVSYTKKKYVRKRKGDPAGMVVVEKEEVILAQPEI